MNRSAVLAFLSAMALAGCSSLHTPLPLTEAEPVGPMSSSAFAGHARAFRFEKGAWVPVPEYDYDFLVLERRFVDHWDAIKEIHRRHPRYDGLAEPRDETLYFSVRKSPAADGGFDLAVETSVGNGSGHEKPGGKGVAFELASARKGWLIPFDTIRIRQDRAARGGRLEETVELLSKGKGYEVPFMKMEEDGLIYRPVGR
jgi:hypothetical protein